MSKSKDYIGFFKVDERRVTIWKNKKQIEDFINSLDPGKYFIKISEYNEERTISQNKFYWKLIEIIAREIGYEVQEMHEVFKYKFLKKTFEDANGNLVKGFASSADLDKKDFSDYIEKIKRYVEQDLKINLPESF